ncbi:hypothetical protein CRYUN_Cryun27aG0005600 [Craigia yunnanensis]
MLMVIFTCLLFYDHALLLSLLVSINLLMQDVGTVCEQLPHLVALNLSNNLMIQNHHWVAPTKRHPCFSFELYGHKLFTGEILEHLLPVIEELHLMGNNISTIKPTSSSIVQGFDSLRLLNLEDNCLAEWNEILKVSQLKSLEQLYLNKNKLTCIFYPDKNKIQELHSNRESFEESYLPFQNLRCLLLRSNKINNLASIDSLNSFPKLIGIRLSDNPVADPARSGLPRFVLIARLAKVEMLNRSEISARERKESEIRYVRLVMSKLLDNPEERKWLHHRFVELKNFYGIEDEVPSVGAAGPQKMASGLVYES